MAGGGGLRPYRDPRHPRRATWVRDFDFGPSGHWRFVAHVVFAVARYVCVPDDIRIGLESIPAIPFKEDSHQPVQMGKLAVVVMPEPMRIFVSADRLLLPPLSVVLMMEESLGFVRLGDVSVVSGGDDEFEVPGVAGLRRLALRIRRITLVLPNERFARYVAFSRGVSCDTKLGVHVGTPTAFGHVSLSAAQKGGIEVQVPGRMIEDHIRVGLHPDTHILLGYFEPVFCEEYAHRVLAMLKTPPRSGKRVQAGYVQ